MTACGNNSKGRVELKTQDNKTIIGTYYPSDGKTGLVLLHMLNNNKHSYDKFASIASKNYKVLSIDFRGHGESGGDWHSFTDKDFIAMEKDAKAAADYLKSKGCSKVYVIGASIGANTAINLAAHDKDITGAVTLSPSRNYHGIDTEDSIKGFNKRLFIATSKEDIQSYEDSLYLYDKAAGDKQIEEFAGSLHGTNLLSSKFTIYILSWIS